MSRHFRVAKLLTKANRAQFHSLAMDERTTINALRKWLVDRGHDVSRNAVANYRGHLRGGFMSDMRRELSAYSDADLRRKLTACARRISGAALVSVAFLAAFHAGIETRREGRSKGN